MDNGHEVELMTLTVAVKCPPNPQKGGNILEKFNLKKKNQTIKFI